MDVPHGESDTMTQFSYPSADGKSFFYDSHTYDLTHEEKEY